MFLGGKWSTQGTPHPTRRRCKLHTQELELELNPEHCCQEAALLMTSAEFLNEDFEATKYSLTIEKGCWWLLPTENLRSSNIFLGCPTPPDGFLWLYPLANLPFSHRINKKLCLKQCQFSKYKTTIVSDTYGRMLLIGSDFETEIGWVEKILTFKIVHLKMHKISLYDRPIVDFSSPKYNDPIINGGNPYPDTPVWLFHAVKLPIFTACTYTLSVKTWPWYNPSVPLLPFCPPPSTNTTSCRAQIKRGIPNLKIKICNKLALEANPLSDF